MSDQAECKWLFRRVDAVVVYGLDQIQGEGRGASSKPEAVLSPR